MGGEMWFTSDSSLYVSGGSVAVSRGATVRTTTIPSAVEQL